MAKRKSKIENITGMTPSQIETALDVALNNGWELITVVEVGSNVFGVLVKTIAE